jgi:hypothetical protein
MGIINRRNAVLGWAVWEVSKRAARVKARSSRTSGDAPAEGKKRRSHKAVVVATLAAAGGVLVFWRRRGSGADEPPPE